MWNKITIIAHEKINEVSCSVRNTSLDSHLAMEVTQTDLRRTLRRFEMEGGKGSE